MQSSFNPDAIQVLDDLLSPQELSMLAQRLAGPVWRFGWAQHYGVLDRPCWHAFIAGSAREQRQDCEQELRERAGWTFLADWWAGFKDSHLPQATLLGVYANGQTSGQDGPIHRDNRPDEPGKTLVMFCNEHWATAWGGELLFFNAAKTDVIKAVLPKPGRIVLFDGRIPHSARSPTASCNRLRVSLAFKTLIKE
ncbi:2OG-Fe(II) oxygenase [Pseudomonas sp. L7]|uniref:2OG-Fe(II) oxygenase n=1 Tax=Pseudomonas TaxID=286 RepID=UPI001648CD00|nr:2OG-Fe(II) oxygenase [Pseudomonas sp. RW3S2]MBC3419205.1 2OG-Fe(II) oxygenase [Pseudomonas sp. RW3S2]